MNKIVLVGRLTKDPEVRTTGTGISSSNFTVAVNRNYKNKEGNYDADFLPCVAFRNSADFINKFFKKGNLICVEGRVQVRNYDAQDGTKRYVTEVMVENAEFVGGKNENSTSNTSSNNNYVDAPSADPIDEIPEIEIQTADPYENNNKEISLTDDDIPF